MSAPEYVLYAGLNLDIPEGLRIICLGMDVDVEIVHPHSAIPFHFHALHEWFYAVKARPGVQTQPFVTVPDEEFRREDFWGNGGPAYLPNGRRATEPMKASHLERGVDIDVQVFMLEVFGEEFEAAKTAVFKGVIGLLSWPGDVEFELGDSPILIRRADDLILNRRMRDLWTPELLNLIPQSYDWHKL